MLVTTQQSNRDFILHLMTYCLVRYNIKHFMPYKNLLRASIDVFNESTLLQYPQIHIYYFLNNYLI